MDRLPLFLDLKNRRVGVIGGGAVAARRMETLFRAGADVWLFATALERRIRRAAGPVSPRRPGRPQRVRRLSPVLFRPRGRRGARKPRAARPRPRRGALVNVADHPGDQRLHRPLGARPQPAGRRHFHRRRRALLGRMLKARLETLIPAAYGRLAALAGAGRAALADKLADHRRAAALLGARLRRPHRRNGAGRRRRPGAKRRWRRKSPPAGRTAPPPTTHPRGEVYLVGAGPGDPDLLTFRAFRLMQTGRCRALRPAGRARDHGPGAPRRRAHLCRQEARRPRPAAGGNRRADGQAGAGGQARAAAEGRRPLHFRPRRRGDRKARRTSHPLPGLPRRHRGGGLFAPMPASR